MAGHILYWKCKFKTQGDSCPTAREKDRKDKWVEAIDFSFSAESAYDPVHGQSISQRSYKPAVIKSVACSNLALMLTALAKNETITEFIVEIPRSNQDTGKRENHIVVKLTDARVIAVDFSHGGVEQTGNTSAKATGGVDVEAVVTYKLTFDKVEISAKDHKLGNEKQFMDSWSLT